MVSVTRRIAQVKQPRGGYLNPKEFEETKLDDTLELHPEENIHAGLVGMAVDYLTRYMVGASVEDAFSISLQGAFLLGESDKAQALIKQIKGLDDVSIRIACQLVGYDVCLRAGVIHYRPVEDIHANDETVSNIRVMVDRSLTFWEQFGPITKDHVTFESGYTSTVTTGDGDYLTASTLWDFKVSKSKPNNKNTLQLLMYYILGLHSIHKEFKALTHLGFYNPRLNTVYLVEISKISNDILNDVATDVVGILTS